MSETITVDVAVVGAGPAGSSAAISLARAGQRVLLADRARFPRDKCCGDGLTTGALRRLQALGLEPKAVPSFTVVDDLSVRSPSGRVARLGFAGGRAAPGTGGVRAAVARRVDLDAALLDLARSSGVDVVEGRAFEAIAVGETARSPIELRLAGDVEVRARYVIGADGAWSPLRRALSGGAPGSSSSERSAVSGRGGRRRGDWHAFRTYASGVGDEASMHLWVWFAADLLPGYAWSFPLSGGRANVGICVAAEGRVGGGKLAEAWRATLDSPFMRSLLGRAATLEEPARSWPIPAGIGEGDLSALGGRVLFTGDAARAADPFTGEGIAQALETGMLAAESVVRLGGCDPAAVGEHYASAVASSLGVEQKIAQVCRSLMARPLGSRGAVRLSGVSPWTQRQVGRWLYEDYPRSLPLRPWQWRPGLLGQPAPYAELAGGRADT